MPRKKSTENKSQENIDEQTTKKKSTSKKAKENSNELIVKGLETLNQNLSQNFNDLNKNINHLIENVEITNKTIKEGNEQAQKDNKAIEEKFDGISEDIHDIPEYNNNDKKQKSGLAKVFSTLESRYRMLNNNTFEEMIANQVKTSTKDLFSWGINAFKNRKKNKTNNEKPNEPSNASSNESSTSNQNNTSTQRENTSSTNISVRSKQQQSSPNITVNSDTSAISKVITEQSKAISEQNKTLSRVLDQVVSSTQASEKSSMKPTESLYDKEAKEKAEYDKLNVLKEINENLAKLVGKGGLGGKEEKSGNSIVDSLMDKAGDAIGDIFDKKFVKKFGKNFGKIFGKGKNLLGKGFDLGKNIISNIFGKGNVTKIIPKAASGAALTWGALAAGGAMSNKYASDKLDKMKKEADEGKGAFAHRGGDLEKINDNKTNSTDINSEFAGGFNVTAADGTALDSWDGFVSDLKYMFGLGESRWKQKKKQDTITPTNDNKKENKAKVTESAFPSDLSDFDIKTSNSSESTITKSSQQPNKNDISNLPNELKPGGKSKLERERNYNDNPMLYREYRAKDKTELDNRLMTVWAQKNKDTPGLNYQDDGKGHFSYTTGSANIGVEKQSELQKYQREVRNFGEQNGFIEKGGGIRYKDGENENDALLRLIKAFEESQKNIKVTQKKQKNNEIKKETVAKVVEGAVESVDLEKTKIDNKTVQETIAKTTEKTTDKLEDTLKPVSKEVTEINKDNKKIQKSFFSKKGASALKDFFFGKDKKDGENGDLEKTEDNLSFVEKTEKFQKDVTKNVKRILDVLSLIALKGMGLDTSSIVGGGGGGGAGGSQPGSTQQPGGSVPGSINQPVATYGGDISYKEADNTKEKLKAKIKEYNPKASEEYLEKTASGILKGAKDTNMNPELLSELMVKESGFNANAKAKGGSATGLMQLTDANRKATFQKYGKELAQMGITPQSDPNDPYVNTVLGSLFYKDQAKSLQKDGLEVNALNLHAQGLMPAHNLVAKAISKYPEMDFQQAYLQAAKDSGVDVGKAQGWLGSAMKANKPLFFNKDGSAKTNSQVGQMLNPGKIDLGLGGATTKGGSSSGGSISPSGSSSGGFSGATVQAPQSGTNTSGGGGSIQPSNTGNKNGDAMVTNARATLSRIMKASGGKYSQNAKEKANGAADCTSFARETLQRSGVPKEIIGLLAMHRAAEWPALLQQLGFGMKPVNPANLSNLQPGDLLVKNTSSQGHVEMYAGDGNVIGAHSTKSGVSEKPLARSDVAFSPYTAYTMPSIETMMQNYQRMKDAGLISKNNSYTGSTKLSGMNAPIQTGGNSTIQTNTSNSGGGMGGGGGGSFGGGAGGGGAGGGGSGTLSISGSGGGGSIGGTASQYAGVGTIMIGTAQNVIIGGNVPNIQQGQVQGGVQGGEQQTITPSSTTSTEQSNVSTEQQTIEPVKQETTQPETKSNTRTEPITQTTQPETKSNTRTEPITQTTQPEKKDITINENGVETTLPIKKVDTSKAGNDIFKTLVEEKKKSEKTATIQKTALNDAVKNGTLVASNGDLGGIGVKSQKSKTLNNESAKKRIEDALKYYGKDKTEKVEDYLLHDLTGLEESNPEEFKRLSEDNKLRQEKFKKLIEAGSIQKKEEITKNLQDTSSNIFTENTEEGSKKLSLDEISKKFRNYTFWTDDAKDTAKKQNISEEEALKRKDYDQEYWQKHYLGQEAYKEELKNPYSVATTYNNYKQVKGHEEEYQKEIKRRKEAYERNDYANEIFKDFSEEYYSYDPKKEKEKNIQDKVFNYKVMHNTEEQDTDNFISQLPEKYYDSKTYKGMMDDIKEIPETADGLKYISKSSTRAAKTKEGVIQKEISGDKNAYQRFKDDALSLYYKEKENGVEVPKNFNDYMDDILYGEKEYTLSNTYSDGELEHISRYHQAKKKAKQDLKGGGEESSAKNIEQTNQNDNREIEDILGSLSEPEKTEQQPKQNITPVQQKSEAEKAIEELKQQQSNKETMSPTGNKPQLKTKEDFENYFVETAKNSNAKLKSIYDQYKSGQITKEEQDKQVSSIFRERADFLEDYTKQKHGVLGKDADTAFELRSKEIERLRNEANKLSPETSEQSINEVNGNKEKGLEQTNNAVTPTPAESPVKKGGFFRNLVDGAIGAITSPFRSNTPSTEPNIFQKAGMELYKFAPKTNPLNWFGGGSQENVPSSIPISQVNQPMNQGIPQPQQNIHQQPAVGQINPAPYAQNNEPTFNQQQANNQPVVVNNSPQTINNSGGGDSTPQIPSPVIILNNPVPTMFLLGGDPYTTRRIS